MAVDAVLSLEHDLNLKMIGVKKVAGGSLTDSVLVKGVAFKKTFSYAGFEQQVRLPRGLFVLSLALTSCCWSAEEIFRPPHLSAERGTGAQVRERQR